MREHVNCPSTLDFLPSATRSASSASASASASTAIERIKLAAYESLRQDDTGRTDARMAAAGRRFLECDGIETLYRMIGKHERMDEQMIADDARQARKSLHRKAYPLALFLHLHVADKPTRLGAAVGRRMMFGKFLHGKTVSSTRQRSSSKSAFSSPYDRDHDHDRNETKPRRRVRSSWHVSPLLFRIIVAYTKVTGEKMTGGRLLGTGRNETKVYTFDDIAKVHPRMRTLCMHMYGHPQPQNGLKPVCFSGRDAEHVVRLVNSAVSDIPTPFLSGIALKDVLDDEDAGTELQFHQRIHRWFSEVHSIHLTCLHPQLHFLELDETPHTNTERTGVSVATRDMRGHRLLVNRLLMGDTYHLTLSEEELYNLADTVLRGLEIFHAHNYLHMDIKPENILWDVDDFGQKRQYCLSDYNLMMSDSNLLHHIRPDDGGGFQSLSHGTEGYKSPLLMLDDVKGSTYRTCDYVAIKSRAFPRRGMPVWREYFEKARVHTSMGKLDLHGLALTLKKLITEKKHDEKESLRMMQGHLGKFIAKLLFFRPHDFRTATEARVHLKTNSEKRSLRRQHPQSVKPQASGKRVKIRK